MQCSQNKIIFISSANHGKFMAQKKLGKATKTNFSAAKHGVENHDQLRAIKSKVAKKYQHSFPQLLSTFYAVHNCMHVIFIKVFLMHQMR